MTKAEARKPAKITVDWLEDFWACSEELDIFISEFGTQAELSLKNLLRAAELGLDMAWLFESMWDDRQQDADGIDLVDRILAELVDNPEGSDKMQQLNTKLARHIWHKWEAEGCENLEQSPSH